MTFQMAGQPLLHAVQQALQALVQPPGTDQAQAPLAPDRSRCHPLHDQMENASRCLLDALGRGQEFDAMDFSQASDDARERWRAWRREVEALGEAYAAAVAEYREAMQDPRAKSRRPRWMEGQRVHHPGGKPMTALFNPSTRSNE